MYLNTPFYSDTEYFIYLLISWQTLEYFHVWSLWIMHLWAFMDLFLCAHVFSFLVCILCGIAKSHNSVFNILKNCKTFFQRESPILFKLATYNDSSFSMSSPKLVITVIFYFNHSNVHKVISYCGFDLNFSKDKWC